MNLESFLLFTFFAMKCITLGISHTETKSWIRHTRSSSLNFECPDCLSQEAEVAQQDSPSLLRTSGDGNAGGEGSSKTPRARHQHQLQQGRRSKGVKKCVAERDEKRRAASNSSGTPEYIPVCRRDGGYAAVQCHPSTKSCFCVTPSGRPIPGSSVLQLGSTIVRPNCSKYRKRGKSATRRRSSLAKNNRNSCNYADRSRFNVALIRTFRSEYNRIRSISASFFDSDGVNDDSVLAWKFDHLDKDKDSMLHKNETIILKNLVKQQIQPRACAKNFISFCAKGDQRITKKEWIECLRIPSVDNLPFDTFNSLVDSGSSPGGIHPSQLLKPGGLSSGGGEFTHLNSGGSEAAEVSNCWTDRQSAIASQIRNETVIIPECTINGLYHKVQCAQGKTYCWCVEEDSGIQIPNTVVVNSAPDCNNRYSKPMKGCSGPKKHKFLSDLLETLIRQMNAAGNEGRKRLPVDTRNMAMGEQAARWYYAELDSNANGILERNEWKVFRNETSKDKRLKKCGKKLPRHCDVNQDKKISMTEWLDCLGVKFLNNKPSSSNKRPVNRSNGPRQGKNPFTTILN